ncbi:MAG: DUF4097 family beta strand repeat-containing protein, partial [Acidobacteria bacterium]|nr:DUF4097 family beta strand repeat-containing protein [Acidobacteriota bacterium]
MRNSPAFPASWKAMNTFSRRALARRSAESCGPGLWIVFAIGLLLMAAASLLRADDSGNVARRTERFNATLPARSRLRVLNVSGDVIATPGREFSAVCQTTVTATTKARADEILERTRTVQVRDGDELRLESRWPDMGDSDWSRRSSRSGQWRNSRCRDCRITMQYEIVVPPGVVATLHTVNGEVRIQDVDGELDAQTVNGNVTVRGSRRGVRAQTVNGKIEVAATAAPQGAALDLRTVSGAVLLTLPKDARFDLSASAMNGSIVSTFPFVPRTAPAAGPEASGSESERAERAERRARAEHSRTRHPVVVERRGADTMVDVAELERDLEESMKDMDVQVRESLRDAERETSRMKFLMPGGEYKGSIGPSGGARVHVSTLNGRIAILAANTRESDAKPLVARRSFVLTIPRIDTRIHEKISVPRSPRPPRTDGPAHHGDMEEPEDGAVVRGDVAGDFLATAGAGTYRVGKVSGKVNILTHSGEIHIGAAGASADLKSYGGDIQIGPVQGDLKAQTLAGDIRAGAVAGSVSADTSGGDVRIDRVAGSADVKTGGGDVVLPSVAGGVHVETGGGEVRVGLVSREARGGVTIRNAGGDVT